MRGKYERHQRCFRGHALSYGKAKTRHCGFQRYEQWMALIKQNIDGVAQRVSTNAISVYDLTNPIKVDVASESDLTTVTIMRALVLGSVVTVADMLEMCKVFRSRVLDIVRAESEGIFS